MQDYISDEAASFLKALEWFHLYLLNFMEQSLSEEVVGTIKNDFEPTQVGGPLTFVAMIDKVINLSESAID